MGNEKDNKLDPVSNFGEAVAANNTTGDAAWGMLGHRFEARDAEPIPAKGVTVVSGGGDASWGMPGHNFDD